MTEIIAEALAVFLNDVPFADVVVGLVKEVSYKDEERGAAFRYPAYYQTTAATGYRDLVPNSRKRSIQYVENYGTRVVDRHGDRVDLKTTVRVVCWGNKAMSSLASAYVLAAVPESANIAGLSGVRFTPIQVLGVDEKIFSRYTYNEDELQFLLHPYTAFAIVYEVTYSLNLSCLPVTPALV